jgi:hypothetical protein
MSELEERGVEVQQGKYVAVFPSEAPYPYPYP